MSKPWTTREQKDCAAAYSTEGMEAALSITGRTKTAVYRMMGKLGIRSSYDYSAANKKERKWFREDVALMFELLAAGLSSSLIAEHFNTSAASIRNVISLAKSQGFDAYPPRNK
jgi:hypothetical protein